VRHSDDALSRDSVGRGAVSRDSVSRAARPVHVQPRFILLVGLGGALGTLARYGAQLVVPHTWQLPWPTLIVNLVGAFLLGFLLEALVRRGRDDGGRRAMRLLIGTGFMGGFTTYSSLAVETSELLRDDRLLAAAGYGLVTLVVGLFASLLGMWLAAAHHRSVVRRSARDARPGATA
jgi:CrcB protein